MTVIGAQTDAEQTVGTDTCVELALLVVLMRERAWSNSKQLKQLLCVFFRLGGISHQTTMSVCFLG